MTDKTKAKPWAYKTRTVVDGQPLEVTFEVDWQTLAHVTARKALANSRRTTRLAFGSVKATIKENP